LEGSISKYGDSETRAIRITNPDSSQEMYAYFDRATNGAPAAYPSGQLPDATGFHPLDSGDTNYTQGVMNVRDSYYWGRNQCAALSTTEVTNLNSLTAHDFLLGRMSHWKLASDGVSLGSAVSMVQAPSPDGVTNGVQTWYDYQYYSSHVWEMLDDNTKPRAMLRLEPDGTTWHQQYGFRCRHGVSRRLAPTTRQQRHGCAG
jgi:hypothetical protein